MLNQRATGSASRRGAEVPTEHCWAGRELLLQNIVLGPKNQVKCLKLLLQGAKETAPWAGKPTAPSFSMAIVQRSGQGSLHISQLLEKM